MARKERTDAAKRGDTASRTSYPPSPLPAVIGGNLKSLRTRQGHSLERLAKLAGVSRAMLGQIENGQSVPTILLLLKIADALAVPLAALEAGPRVEFYEARLAARHAEALDAQPGGAKESFVVLKGRVELTVGSEPPIALAEGDAAYVQASEAPRTLRNLDGSEAVLHIVVSFAGVK